MRNLRKHIALASRAMAVVAAVAMLLSLPSCGGGRVPQSLVEADSLMTEAPDSALSLLLELPDDSLPSKEAHAYQALLVTQAMYKCYLSFDSDSLINVALDYYKHHGDRDKLTRALTYKGAVMEELGDASAAIEYYKQAESTADPEDHFNLGYAKLRIASAYQGQHMIDSTPMLLHKEALREFTIVGDEHYRLLCYNAIGSEYRDINPDSAIWYLQQAISLSKRTAYEDLRKQSCYLELAIYYALLGVDYEQAILYIDSIFSQGPYLLNQSGPFLVKAQAFANLGKPDSARYYLKRSEDFLALSPTRDSVYYLKCKADIAKYEGDSLNYYKYERDAESKSSNALIQSLQVSLKEADQKYDNEVLTHSNLRYKYSLILALIAVLLLLSLSYFLYQLYTRKKQQTQENIMLIEQLHNDIRQMDNALSQHKNMNERLKGTIKSQIDTISALIEKHDILANSQPNKFIENFKQAVSINKTDESFWKEIQAYVDSEYNQIITRLKSNNNDLTQNDINFLCLCCCQMPPTIIMSCMGYSDVHAVYTRKQRLAKKLNLSGKLDEFLQSNATTAEE